MKKLWLRVCSMLLAICITANLLPLTAWADQIDDSDSKLSATEEAEQVSDQDSAQTQIIGEVIENRTEFTKEFLLNGGLSLAVVYDSAVHYEKDGQWEEIDNTLKSNLTGTYTNTAGVWDVSFPKQLSANKQISITKDGYTLSFAMAGELLKQGNLEVMSSEEPSEVTMQTVSAQSVLSSLSVDPQEPVPETTVPAETTPETTEPEETVPETTAPSETIPEDTVPEVTVPEETVPETTVPEETNPTEATFPEIVPTEAVVAPSVPTVSVTVNGKVETFAVNTAKTSAGQIQQIDLGKVRAEAEHQETILQKPYSQLLYSDVYTNTNVQYDLIGNQVKESIILESHNTSLRGFQFTLNTGKLIPILEDDGHIDFYDESRKNIVMTMPAPYLVDSSFEHSDDVNVSISGKDGAYTLTYILPQQWLSSSERAWPVILDPVIKASIDINNIQDVTVGSKKSRDYTNGINACGVSQTYGVQRCYLQYVDLPELKASDVIVSATVRMYKPESSSAAKSVMVHKVTDTWTSSTLTWSNAPQPDPIIQDYVRAQNENFYYWEITDIVREWYTGENTGMVFKVADSVEAKTDETSWREFYSSDYGGPASKPTLEIYFRNNNGLEGYWDYTSSTAGRAGTGYVNQYTGNLTWVHEDLGFGGNRMPVSISHVYNTNDNTDASFGMGNGWRTNFNQSVYQWSKDDDYYVWEDSDGTAHYFKEDTSTKYKDEDGLGLTLKVINSENGKYSITDKKGNISYFDTNGRLTKQLKDQKEDSFIEITYTTETGKLIDTITDGVERNYKFTYNTDNLLTRISYTGKEPETEGAADPEITYVAFEYTGGNLSKITDADNKSVTYTYTGNSLLASAKDIDDYTLRYEFNTVTEGQPNRVSKITESDDGKLGGELSIEYAHNQTTLTDHNGQVQILQFNDFGNTTCIQDGEGHAQYAQYAKTKSGDSGKGNQLKATSKLQNTVANRLMDSSFEDGTLWTKSSGTVSVSTAEHYLGKKSLSAVGATCNSTGFTIAAGESYTFSAYIKTTGSTSSIAIMDGSTVVAEQPISDATDWTRFQVSYTNTSESPKNLTAALCCGSSDTVYMDCVQVEKAPTASRYNLVQNGDFSFEGDPAAGWELYRDDATEIRTTLDDSAAPQLDNNVFKFVGGTSVAKLLMQTIPISGEAGDTYVVAGWGKGDAVPMDHPSDSRDRQFGVRVTFNNTDGTTTKIVARFNPDTNSEANWQYTAAAAVAKKKYKSINVDVLYKYNANTAYFDGIQLFKEEFSQSYAYDNDGNIVSVTDLQKQKTEYKYENNNLTQQTLPNGAVMKYTYDNWHNVETATTDTGLKYTFTYDDYGNNTKVSITNNKTAITSTAEYSDDYNRMVKATDATGKITEYSYNEDTNVLEWVKYPKDTGSTKTTYTYDTMYRMASAAATTDTGLALSANYTYTDDLLTSIKTGNTGTDAAPNWNTVYTFNYGDFALRSNVKVGSRTLASYTYTDRDNYLSSLDYGNGDKVQYTYDDQGRVTKQSYEDGSKVEYRYDNDGALATVTDSATGRTTTYYYDFIDRMMKYVETGTGYSHSVGYEYDDINNLTKLVETINGAKVETAYSYDDDNRVTDITSGDATKHYDYDNFGRVGKQETKKGETTVKTDRFEFTAPSITSTDPDITGFTSSQVSQHIIDAAGYDKTFTYTYDGNGNILSISDGTNTTSYVYDSANQLVRENQYRHEDPVNTWSKVWTYDNAGNILKCDKYAYSDNDLTGDYTTITYGYGDASWGDLLTAYDGKTIISDSIGNPVHDGTWSYSWQRGRQLARMEGKPGNNPADTTNPYISVDFTYNADGIRTRKEVTTYSLQDVSNQTGIYLCSDGEIRCFTNGKLTQHGLVKDEYDNYYYIRSSFVAVRNQEYWITTTNGLITAGSYYFGPDGRMVVDLAHGDDGTLYTGIRTDLDGETRYYENGIPTYAGLVEVGGDFYYFTSSKKAVRNGTYYVTKHNDLLPEGNYVFDADGKMVNPPTTTAQTAAASVMTTRATGTYQVWTPGTTTVYEYVYNGDKLSQMTVGSETLNFAYDASGTPMTVQYNGTTYYYVTNIQGDVIALLDSNGTAVVEYAYDAWGNLLDITVVEDAPTEAQTLGEINPLRYRGYVYDQEYGFYYLQSRYYDPEVGRFLNADAFVATGQGIIGNNMFAYCHNNPVLYVDPSGHIILLSIDVTEEQEKEYERAIAYLKTSETGRKLIECLETSSEVFTIVFVDDDNMSYSPSTNTIQFDTNSGLVVGDGTSAQSAALGLAHEMGHAAQDLDGIINALMGDTNLIEANNLEVYETPIAKELGEPTRRYYDDCTKVIDMQNSTHFISTSVRPWWNYLFFWNWGKPSKVTIDHNVP